MVDDARSGEGSDAQAGGADARSGPDPRSGADPRSGPGRGLDPGPDEVAPVRRPPRGGRRGARRTRATSAPPTPPQPSLRPVLLSGRSLEAPPSDGVVARLRGHRGRVLLGVFVVLVVAAVLGGRQLATGVADSAMEQRADELSELLDGATPEDFLAFGVAVDRDGSLAQRVRDLDGFVNVRANADYAFMRFQPSEWWSGFTERCLVAVVRTDGVTVETPRTRCLRVPEPTR